MIHLVLFARSLKINSIHIVQECDANEAKLKFNKPGSKKFYHTNVPALDGGKVTFTHLFLYLILKDDADVDSFSTINTFFPVGVLKAAVVKLVANVLAIRTEPAGTNLEACAMI
jgi:hypothetical protein